MLDLVHVINLHITINIIVGDGVLLQALKFCFFFVLNFIFL